MTVAQQSERDYKHYVKTRKNMAKKATSKGTISDALAILEKKHGKGAVMKLAKGEQITKVELLPTGIYSIDKALGGGFARGRVVELYGNEGSGKTTLALQTIAKAQADGLKAAFIDVEHAFSLQYARSLGVDLEELYFSQPKSAEMAMDIAKTLAQTGEFAVVVVDSVAALTPDTEFDGEIGKAQIGHLARFMSAALRQIVGEFHKTGTSLIFINQLRMKIGVMFGNPETTPGGNALKYYASQRLAIRKSTKIDNKEGVTIGYNALIRVEKNKIALPNIKATVPVTNGKGFDKVADMFQVAELLNVITKEKASYFFNGEKLGVYEVNAKQALYDSLDIYTAIEEAVIALNNPDESANIV